MRFSKHIEEGCSGKKKKLITEEGDKYKCECGWVYDPASTGKEFSEESSDYKCPKCGEGKSAFTKM